MHILVLAFSSVRPSLLSSLPISFPSFPLFYSSLLLFCLPSLPHPLFPFSFVFYSSFPPSFLPPFLLSFLPSFFPSFFPSSLPIPYFLTYFLVTYCCLCIAVCWPRSTCQQPSKTSPAMLFHPPYLRNLQRCANWAG